MFDLIAYFIAGFFMLLTGTTGDLLDTIPTDAYWKSRNITPTVETMRTAANPPVVAARDVSADIESLASPDFKIRDAARKSLESQGASIIDQLTKAGESKDPEIAATCKEILRKLSSASQAAAVQRLMAIRTLGELKDKDSAPLLKTLSQSKELFVAEYATRSLDQITGESHSRAPASIDADINLLPLDTGMVGQVRWGNASADAFRLDLLLTRLRMSQARPNELLRAAAENRKAIALLSKKIASLAGQTGNFRMDGLTVGVSKDMGDNSGSVVIILRGLYDHNAALAAFKAENQEITDEQGIPLVKLRGADGEILFPSNDLLVFINGANPAIISAASEEMAKALKAGKGEFPKNAEMAALLKKIDTTKDIWAVVQVNDFMKQEPLFADFDLLTLQASHEKGTLTYKIEGTGPDADKVKDAVSLLEGQIKDVLNDLKQQQAANGPDQSGPADIAMAKAGTKVLEAIKLSANGKSATLSGTVEPLKMFMAMLGTVITPEQLLGGNEFPPSEVAPPAVPQ